MKTDAYTKCRGAGRIGFIISWQMTLVNKNISKEPL